MPLDRALIVLTDTRGGERSALIAQAKKIMGERGQLHGASLEAGNPIFMSVTDIECKSRLATSLAAAHVNVYIARNYMAHRDERDFEMAFGMSDDQREADGATALGAAMTCLVVCLALEPDAQRKEKGDRE